MRIRISHLTSYRYENPATGVIQMLRLTPRNDPANGICATDAHVRVAIGLDYLGAAPLRGTRYGDAGEVLAVKVRVAQAAQQTQN
jgi:transglutaminase-like putative cysteine protease